MEALTILLAVDLNAVFGVVWRHRWGGWGGYYRRRAKIVDGLGLAWPLSGLAEIFFLPGHRVDGTTSKLLIS